MALLTIASASAFGMYGDRDSWIDFLVHGNQLRARMDQLGFVLGNGTIKGTFGFRSQSAVTKIGNILSGNTGNVDLQTTISAGIGYTSEPFGIGVGY
ncbi:cell surface protein, partial [Brachyspira hyodysenteriae]